MATISTSDCIRELCNRNKNTYKKGVIDSRLEEKLTESCKKACERGKKLQVFENPSTNMDVFLEELKSK